ncbi:MAG: hypothetical protein EHM24_25625 [Acidobacteria bacterium]|nr:MAG: hypothetical protein EHM24_25625 [Acidobacteriota bacterium]
MRQYESGVAFLRDGKYVEALKDFQAVVESYPNSRVVDAVYHAGEALRLMGRFEEATTRYRRISTDFPRSAWAGRALIGEARCLVAAGKPERAMERLQRVRQRFAGTPEASLAVALNTVLYRLYLRAPAQLPYQPAARAVAGPGGKLKDVQALAIDAEGTLLVAASSEVLVFDPSGRPGNSIRAPEPRGVSVDADGQPVISHKGGVIARGQNLRLSLPRPDGSPRLLNDIAAAVATPRGDLLVADRGAKAIARFSAAGQFLEPFAAVGARRLAIDPTGVTAAIEEDGGNIVILEPDGASRARLAGRGEGYQFERAVDLAFDFFGHLYVLDRNQGTVVIFVLQPQPEVLATVSLAPGSPGSIRKATAFALDPAGRLFVYDGDAPRIQVYQ